MAGIDIKPIVMKYLIYASVLVFILSSCNSNVQDSLFSDELADGSVSPRAEKNYAYSNEGHQSFSGTNPPGRFDRELVERRKRKQVEADTLQKEFAVNGYSVNTEYHNCELYSTSHKKGDNIEAHLE